MTRLSYQSRNAFSDEGSSTAHLKPNNEPGRLMIFLRDHKPALLLVGSLLAVIAVGLVCSALGLNG